MTTYNFAAANGTDIQTDDAKWIINTNGSGTLLCNGSNQGKCGANGATPTRYYQNGQGAIQTCQLVIFPAAAAGDGRNLSTQMTTTGSGYSIRASGNGAAVALEYRRSGVFVSNPSGTYNLGANTYTIKVRSDSGTGSVKCWIATGNVADAEISGSNILNTTDGSPLTGGFPGIFLTEATVGNAPIGAFNDFASGSILPGATPLRGGFSELSGYLGG